MSRQRVRGGFTAPSRALVERYRPESLELALDLGSGPGHTTRLVHEASRAERTIGIDSSARYVEQARRDATRGPASSSSSTTC